MDKQLDELLKKLKKLGFPVVAKDLKEFLDEFEKQHSKGLRKLIKKLDCHNEWKEIRRKLMNLGDYEIIEDLKDVLKKLDCHKELKEIKEKLKKFFGQEEFKDFYDALKKLGVLIEFKLNERIQDGLNKKEIIKFLHNHSHLVNKILKGLKELIETVSIPLNLPTKNDVANVAKLTIQNEEKLEEIEEQLKILNKYLRELSDGNIPSIPIKEEEDLDKKIKKLKKLVILNTLMQFSSNLGEKKE